MNKRGLIFFLLVGTLLLLADTSLAQCSICTKTASQLGEKPAAALNTAILYLMLAPLGIIAFLGWKWWKSNKG
jgi:TRAP-type C4-dicarboxylate transport system permease small subunit